MKVEIIDDSKIYVDGSLIFEKSKEKKSLADIFAKYNGTPEYEGIIATIQKWYYGYVSHTPWCVTSVCYFLNELGLLDKIGGKSENVYLCMAKCKQASGEGKGTFYDKEHIPQLIPKDALLFYEWDNKEMSVNSNKHLSVCYEDTETGNIKSVGGNQSDMICIKTYSRKDLYAMYVINQ